MANYIGTARSNYFKVKSKEDFEDLCARLNVEIITRRDRVGFICEEGLPSSIYDEAKDEDVEVDILAEIAPHLQEGEVAVLVESGHEKCRYVVGYAIAVNWKGEVAEVSITDIYKKAQEELGGENITEAEY